MLIVSREADFEVYVAVCCSLLQRVVGVLQCAVVCCVVLQCAAVHCSVLIVLKECADVGLCLLCVLQCVAVCCSVLQRVAVCCSVLQRVAACCSVLQRTAVCCRAFQCVKLDGLRIVER